MNGFPWEVVVLAAVLAVNRLLVPLTWQRPAAFWAIQALDAGLAVAVAIVGVPGLAAFPVVGWLVAALLAFHVFQNLAVRSAELQRREHAEAERARIRQLRSLEPRESDEAPPKEPAETTEETRPPSA